MGRRGRRLTGRIAPLCVARPLELGHAAATLLAISLVMHVAHSNDHTNGTIIVHNTYHRAGHTIRQAISWTNECVIALRPMVRFVQAAAAGDR